MFTLSSIQNYAKSGIRELTRNKLFLLLSILGLSVGIVAASKRAGANDCNRFSFSVANSVLVNRTMVGKFQ